jgi:short-subunit dehydrogenase
VVIAGRGEAALAAVAREIGAHAIVADVSRWNDVHCLAGETLARFGQIDVWINNAAVAEWSPVELMDPADMARVIEVDLLGTMYGCRAVLEHFRARGRGVIINLASGLADRSVPLVSTYCAAKAGIKAFGDALRLELRAGGSAIDVVTVLPASIDTPLYRWSRSRLGVRPLPLSVVYSPEKVARAIVRAAERPKRDVYVGAMAKVLSLAERLSPALLDRLMLYRNKIVRDQLSDRPDRGQSNLFASVNETRVDGGFRRRSLFRRRRPARG